MLAQARDLAQKGNPQAAFRTLESWLNRPPRRPSDADAAALHLEASRMAVAAGLPEKAENHLGMVRRLSNAFRAAPQLHSRFLRENARLYEQIGRFGEAAPLLASALDLMADREPGAAAEAANALGTAWLELREPARAIAAFERQLHLLDAAPDDRKARVTAFVNLSNAWLESNDVAAARTAWERARDAAQGDGALADAADFAHAQILLREARLREAEGLLQRIADRPALSDPALRGHALLLLATARFSRGLLPEADHAAIAAVEAYRGALGEWHPVLGRTFHTLGVIHEKLRDLKGAAAYYARALDIERRSFGVNSVQFHATEIEQAWLDVQNGDLTAASRRAAAALKAFSTASPPDRRRQGIAHVLLGLIAEARDDRAAAIENLRRGQQLIAAARGEYSPDLGFSLVRLGRLLTRIRRYDEAAVPLDRAVALYERLGGAGTVYMADALAARAELRRRRGDRRGAIEESRRAYAALHDRIGRTDAASVGASEFQRNGARELFAAHAKLLLELAGDDPAARREAFEATQESMISRAADAVRRTMIRMAAGPGELARVLREHEDTADALRQTDALLRAALGRSEAGSDDETRRLSALRREESERLRLLDAELASRFPQHSEFVNPRPVGLAAVQAVLARDEALLVTLAAGDGLIVWTITADTEEVRIAPVSKAELAVLVERLRRGVDLASAAPLMSLPRFDSDAARQLYRLLIAPAEAALADKRHLLFIADGALQTVPLHLLLGGADGDWLVRRFAVTTALSATSLVAQRGAIPPSRAELALLGIGDPQTSLFTAAAPFGSRGLSRGLRSALATLPALPETADELRRMASLFPGGQSKLVLGASATKEAFVESAPGKYRILAFSTHALMAGQLPGLQEPAIVLTPSDAPDSDGLLTASEIGALETDADLIILSACNTAAPDGGPFADGFSGLARAFLHAGARALLVSHWAVASEPTIELMTSFLAARRDGGMRNAEALQQSVVQMLDSGNPVLRHPAFWAPFVVVGS